MDLRVPPGPGLTRALVVPADDLQERFSRSSGPGGQSVNTADSRVEVHLDLTATAALTDAQRSRVLARLADRLVNGVLVVTASEHRSQYRNRLAARSRMAELLAAALAPPPPPRRPTKPSAAARRRRLESKRRHSRLKSGRRPPTED